MSKAKSKALVRKLEVKHHAHDSYKNPKVFSVSEAEQGKFKRFRGHSVDAPSSRHNVSKHMAKMLGVE